MSQERSLCTKQAEPRYEARWSLEKQGLFSDESVHRSAIALRARNPIKFFASGRAVQRGCLFIPVLAGSLVIVATAWCVINARSRASYPKYWL